MAKSIADKIVEAEARVDRARLRLDRAVKKLYNLLGWGTSDELAHARANVSAANTDLDTREETLARLKRDVAIDN